MSGINPNINAWHSTSNSSTYSKLILIAFAGVWAQAPAERHSVAPRLETSLDFSRPIYRGAINSGSASSLLLSPRLGEDLDQQLGSFALGLLARQVSLGNAIETILASHMNEMYE